jgi:hypothetical protein
MSPCVGPATSAAGLVLHPRSAAESKYPGQNPPPPAPQPPPDTAASRFLCSSTVLAPAPAGEYHLPDGQRYAGRFDRGLAPAGSRGTWVDRTGARFAVVLWRAVPPWDLQDSEDVFASREKIKVCRRLPSPRPPLARPPARPVSLHRHERAGEGPLSLIEG